MESGYSYGLGAAALPNEKLTDKTLDKHDVFQFGVSGMYPLNAHDWGGWLFETKNLFSTNERDAKSAFLGGGGIQYAPPVGWYIPLKVEQQVQGNQVATNLSTVTLLDITASVPWYGVDKVISKSYVVSSPVPPTFKLDTPYTHRINQVVAPKSSPLPADDFAVNPAFAFTGGQLLGERCNKQNQANPKWFDSICLNWEANAGLYYLPLEDTPKGSQRVEGYWDASLLVPLAKLPGIPGLKTDVQTTQTQFRVKYGDTVSAANNYTRSKSWSFGVEYVKQ